MENSQTTGTTGTNMTIAPIPQTGWICPRCGKGMAPWVSSCPCVQVQPYPITVPYYPYPATPWYPPTVPYWTCGEQSTVSVSYKPNEKELRVDNC